MRKVFLVVPALLTMLVAGPGASANSAPGALTTATSATAPAPGDPLAQQLQAAIDQQSALAASRAQLAGQLSLAQGVKTDLQSILATNQHTITDTLGKLKDAEQTYHDAQDRASIDAAVAATARRNAIEDRKLLALYTQMRFTNSGTFLEYVLSSSSLSDVMNRASELQHLTGDANSLVDQVSNDLAKAETAEAAAQADAKKAQAAADALQSQQAELARQSANMNSILSQLDTQTQAAAKDLVSLNTQDVALAQRITDLRIAQLDNLIAAAEAADWAAAQFYIQNHLGTVGGYTGGSSGSLIWPVPGANISQEFGPSPYGFEPPFGGYPHFHTGIDLADGLDTPVLAPADGIVVAAMPGSTGYGNHVILVHAGGMLTLFGHLDKMLVNVGDAVHQGQPIGLLGSTGNSTGPHLHFEVKINGVPVNPRTFLPVLPPGASGPPAAPK